MTVAELRRELLAEPQPDLDEGDRDAIQIVLDSGADLEFIREALAALVGEAKIAKLEVRAPRAGRLSLRRR